MYRIVLETDNAQKAMDLIVQGQKNGCRVVSALQGVDTPDDFDPLDAQQAPGRPIRRRVSRVGIKPKEGERLQDYVKAVLKQSDEPLDYREIGRRAKAAGYRGGMARNVVSSCSPVLSGLAKAGEVKKLPRPDGRKGYVYELA